MQCYWDGHIPALPSNSILSPHPPEALKNPCFHILCNIFTELNVRGGKERERGPAPLLLNQEVGKQNNNTGASYFLSPPAPAIPANSSGWIKDRDYNARLPSHRGRFRTEADQGKAGEPETMKRGAEKDPGFTIQQLMGQRDNPPPPWFLLRVPSHSLSSVKLQILFAINWGE